MYRADLLAALIITVDHAAAGGHLETIKWLHENRREGCTRYALTDAAGNGHMETVRWLHRNRDEGCGRRAMVKLEHTFSWMHRYYTQPNRTRSFRKAPRKLGR